MTFALAPQFLCYIKKNRGPIERQYNSAFQGTAVPHMKLVRGALQQWKTEGDKDYM